MSLDYLINLFAYKIYKEKILSHSDIRKMRYGMTVISHEMIKIILLFISFKLIAYLDLFLFSFFILMSIRTFSGGLHFESSLICFIFSFAFFLLTVVILPNLFPVSFYPGLIIGLGGVLILSLNSQGHRLYALLLIIKKTSKILIFSIIINLCNSTDIYKNPLFLPVVYGQYVYRQSNYY